MNKCGWKDGTFKGCDKYTYMSEEFKYCPLCGVSLEKPVKIEIGMFGRFWDNNDEDYSHYAELQDINRLRNIRYQSSAGAWWDNFTPGLPTDIYNEDGTKK